MWSLDEEGRIFELLKSVVENRNYVNVWQRSTKNTTQARGVIKDLDRSKCTIAFSKKIGQLSKKQKTEIEKSKIIEDAKSEDVYKKVLETFPDAELVDVKLKDNK
ncbi:MAG: hypothetical protein CME60_13190 [Halobacteriovoraceae bacterium]|nr:hypothetical protein [Halobacteriovoraceae bacterium]